VDCFDECFEIVLGAEGHFTKDPADPGNWTGGSRGYGACNGTKFGISAAAFPELDIFSLTVDEAKALYRQDYWAKISGELLPPQLALVVFDAAVNNGVRRACIWLQQAVGVVADGIVGGITLDAVMGAAARPEGTTAVCVEFLARRLVFMAGLSTWPRFGYGWARRLLRLQYEGQAVSANASPKP
jgi:lysozyme family protein